jgi:benzoylformate decarboxylase
VATLLDRCRTPALVMGAGVDRAGGWDAAVRLAERTRAAVWAAPAGEGAGFPQDHRQFQGILPLAMAPLAERLAGYDLVVVFGAPIFRYYPYVPGPVVGEETRLIHFTDDAEEAARAPAGMAVIGDVALALDELARMVGEATRPAPPMRARPAAVADGEPLAPAFVMRALAEALPEDAVVVEESASSRAAFYDQVRIKRSGSYYATGSGGLGFAVPGAVGVQLAWPDRPVVCVVGDGAAMYAVQALWTAAQLKAPVVFLVLNNGEYAILKSFAAFHDAPGVPGLDIPGLDIVGIAGGFGCAGRRIERGKELGEELRSAFATARRERRPMVLDVAIDPAVPPLLHPAPSAEGEDG